MGNSYDIHGFRITLVAALAWRAITEIVRRQHATFAFDLRQVHPGISPYGLIELHLRSRDGGQEVRMDFHLGGPHAGSWGAPAGDRGSLLDLLGHAPVAVIDAIERAAGLPPWPGHRLPPSTPSVAAMRKVASELERRVFEPRPWRTTAAFIGWSTDIVCDWHRYVTAPVLPDADGRIALEDRERLSRLVLVHPAPEGQCLTTLEDLEGEALFADLGSGRIGKLTRGGVVPV